MGNVKNIRIDIGFCPMCGQPFTKEDKDVKLHPMKKTINHGIPRTLNPKYNILFPLHLKCHEKLNDLYVNNHKTNPKTKGLNYLKSRVESLKGMSCRFDKKFTEILKQINEDLDKLK